MSSAVDRQLHDYIDQLNNTQKQSLLGFIKTVFPTQESQAISIEQYNRELEDAEIEIEKGFSSSNEEVMERAKKVIGAYKRN